jgi:hypothetical protein
MSNIDVTNPGDVNIANQGDGLVSVDQPVTAGPGTNPGPLAAGLASAGGRGLACPDEPVTLSPSTNPGPLVQAGSEGHGLGTVRTDQPVTVTPAMTAQATVQGGTSSPTSPNTLNVITNDVVQQVYGTGTPKNVFV